MSKTESGLLMKPLQDCTEEELYSLRKASANELKRRVLENLAIVADQYVELYGGKEGIEQMGEDLCTRIAQGRHPGGWASLVKHLVKISG
jgi:hypothetical protein